MQHTTGLDAYALLLVGGLVLGRDVDDAVGVNVKRHLSLVQQRQGCQEVTHGFGG